ncbi:MAG: chloride channel protein [Chloroflexi bacterium]|nr:MAG: chloride channel protein [Chloroflexota bacterium]
MNDAPVNAKSYIRLMVLIALLGVASAVVTFAFMALVNLTTRVIWDLAPHALGLDPRLFTFLVCTLGGLVVGLLVKLFGDHNAIFSDLMKEFGKTGRFDYRHAPGIVVTAFFSLIAGAALGPEAPLADACGGMGTLMGDKLKLDKRETRTLGFGGLSSMLAAFITNPFGGALLSLESSKGGMSGMQGYLWGLFPSLLGSAVATVVFVGLTGSFFSQLYSFPAYIPRLEDLLIAVPLAVIGGLAGLVFTLVFKALRKLMQPLNNHLVLRGLIGGLGMGIIGALLPLTLFSGEEQTVELVKGATTLGFGMLILLAFSKLLATSLLLATGWKGGYIFPIMFAGIALGMASTLLFPGVPTAVTVAAVLAGVLVAVLRAPLFAALFTLALVDAETAPVVAVAVLVGSLMTAYLVRRESRQESAEVQAAPLPTAD